MNFQDIIKPLSLLPTEQTHDSPWDKGPTVVAGNVPSLFTFIEVPPFLVTDLQNYPNRLIFQYNFSFGQDFFIINAVQMFEFSSLLVSAGCLCVKWRQGTVLKNGIVVPNVMRFRLLDYRSDLNWSGFPLYSGQLVKSNFCIEFWADNVKLPKGITQQFNLKTNQIRIPTSITDADSVDLIDTAVLPLNQLTQPFPLVFPIDWSNEAYQDNI